MRRHARAAVLAVLTFAIAAGCARDDASRVAGDGAAVVGGTAVTTLASDLDLLSSLVASDRYTQEVLRYFLFLPLLEYDEKLGYAPALATHWSMEGDTAVVFELRDDVYWHDGPRTTAYDVA